MVGAERTLYYWNSYGAELDDDHPLRKAMADAVRSGWKVVSILHQLQSDSHQCGPWSHVALELFASYFKAGEFCGFGASFSSHEKLRPLSTSCGQAEAINSSYIQCVRDEMRRGLREADASGSMPFRPKS